MCDWVLSVGIVPKSFDEANIGLEDMDSIDLFQQNAMSCLNVFSAAVASGVRKIVFSSSAFSMGYSHVSHVTLRFEQILNS